MKYDFDNNTPRQNTSCVKYDLRSAVFKDKDVIPMWVADMDFDVPDFITDAVNARAAHPIYGYTFRNSTCYQSVIDWVERRNGWKIERDWIGFTPGVVCGFALAIRALTKCGEGVVIQPPVYPLFASVINSNSRVLVNNPLKWGGDRFEIDFEDLDRKLENNKVLLFCNPHNPTGRVFSREELTRVGELCVKHEAYIISDEIHSDLMPKTQQHTHIASLSPQIAERTITLMAPSKTFNTAGLATSVAVTSNPELRKIFNAEVEMIHADMGNIFGTIALTTAYTHGDEWLDQLNEYLEINKNYVLDFVTKNLPNVVAHKSEGTYLMWLDFREWGMASDELGRFMVEKAGLGLNNGRTFGEEGEGFMRINVATSLDTVKQAMNQLLNATKLL